MLAGTRRLSLGLVVGLLALLPAAVGGSAHPGRQPDSTPQAAAATAFTSGQRCAELVAEGRRLSRPAGAARFASWNLHWFPDGEAGSKAAGADLGWLACAIWWLNVDVIAVQEVKQSPRARAALDDVLREVSRLTGGRYVARLDDCGSRVPQHVGLVWNEHRVTAEHVRTLGELNPSGEACGRQLRPGLAARLRFRGGLDLTVISAHFKSKADERALDLRERSFDALPGVLERTEAHSRDGDLLLLGDLNTMGCEDCEPKLSAQDELSAADQVLRRGGLRVVEADAAGTYFYQGRPALLDHAVASLRMRELAPSARAHVAGACAAGAASPLARTGRVAKNARRRLSDHCPIVLDLSDRDMD